MRRRDFLTGAFRPSSVGPDATGTLAWMEASEEGRRTEDDERVLEEMNDLEGILDP